MKKRCLLLLVAVLLFAALFSAAAYAAGEPDRLQLTSIQTGSSVVQFNNPPYETWFIDKGNGAIYAITIASKQQYAIEGERFPYSAATVDGKLNLTLTDGRFKNQKIIVDGTEAAMTVGSGTTATIYRFKTFSASSSFYAECTGTQNGTYLEYSFDAQNGTGSSQFRYDVYNSDGERVQTGTTTEKSFRFIPEKDDTYTLYLTAMDQTLNLSEYAKAELPYVGSADFVIYNGIVTSYKGTGTVITVPDYFNGQKVTGIAANAFGYAWDLEKIILPDSISIDPHAFDNCNAKLFCKVGSTAAHTLSSDLRRSFYDKENDTNGAFALQYMKMSGYDGEILALTGYTGTDTDVIVPNTVDYLYNDAFRDNGTITSVTLPDKVKGIGTNVFNGCRKLNAVTVGSGLTSIGQNAFYNCVALSKLDLTDSKYIGFIGSNAFYNCNADIYCDPMDLSATTWKTVSALPRNFFYEENGLIMELRNDDEKGLTLYRCSSGFQAWLIIPNNVEYIADNAFAGNKALVIVAVGSGSKLREIGSYAFSGCTNLMTVDLESAFALTEIGNYAFSGCEQLGAVKLGANLTSLGSFAFTGCKALTALTMPDKITSIGNGTFYGCSSMNELVLPDNIMYIGGNAFTDGPKKVICGHATTTAQTVSAMPHTFYEKGNEAMGLRWETIGDVNRLSLYHYDGSDTNVVVPNYVTYIADEAFKDNKTIETIMITASVTGIGDNAFNGCSALKQVTLSTTLKSIGAGAFTGCTNVEALALPDRIETIGKDAFLNGPKKVVCDRTKNSSKKVSAMPFTFYEKTNNLLGLRWENQNKDLVLYDYADTADSVDAVIPAYVDAVNKDAFSKLKSTLRSVKLEGLVSEIPTGTFDGYSKLETIELVPETTLAKDAVQNCPKLSKVLGLTDLGVYDTNFGNCPRLMLDLPYASLVLSKDVDYAKAAKLPFTGTLQDTKYANDKVARYEDGVVTALTSGSTTITFYADGKLGQVNVEVVSVSSGLKLPTALTVIKNEAFAGSGAQYVVVPAGTTDIGKRAFADCANLRLINIPNGAVLNATALSGSDSAVVVLSDSDSVNIGKCNKNKISYQFLVD